LNGSHRFQFPVQFWPEVVFELTFTVKENAHLKSDGKNVENSDSLQNNKAKKTERIDCITKTALQQHNSDITDRKKISIFSFSLSFYSFFSFFFD